MAMGRIGGMMVAVGLCLTGGLAQAQTAMTCADAAFQWSDGNPRINLRHILCGEINKKGDPVGMHSTALLSTSKIIAGIDAQPVRPNGLYGATIRFENGTSKFSTLYPDQCTPAQIVASIRYAAANQSGPAQPWGFLGCSASAVPTAEQCTGPKGERFVIRFGVNKEGDINTAFPLMGESCQ
jgi:hypothetical protein